MNDDLLKFVREVKACEKHLGYALYRAVVDDCKDCLHLVLAHCGKKAIKAGQTVPLMPSLSIGINVEAVFAAIRREFGVNS